MNSEKLEILKKQLANYDPDALKELKKMLLDYSKLMELVNLTKVNPISIEDENDGKIHLDSPQAVYKLKDLLS